MNDRPSVSESISILVVDDTPENLSVLTQMLSEQNYEVRVSPNGKLALKSIRSKPPHLVLLDINMPDLNGYQVCETLKADPDICDIPVMFISALHEPVDKLHGFRVGGVDYITKPFEAIEVLARVENQLHLRSLQLQLQRQNQKLQKEIESRQAVEEYLRILKRAIAESIDGIVIAEARVENYPIIFVNNGFERITGYSREEVLGEDFCFMWRDEGKNPNFQKLQHALATRESCQALFYTDRKDKTQFWNELSLSPVHGARGDVTHFIGIQSDVSDRIHVNEELIRAKETADAANKAKSTFIANMSHELRSPLNAILGFSQLMNRSQEISQSDRENISIINRSGEHLLTLINNILDLSKIEAGKTFVQPVNFDLYSLLDDIEDMFILQTENKGLALIFEREENLPQYVCTDLVKLRQVLINLLGNAIKFTPKGFIAVRTNQLPVTSDATPRRRKTQGNAHQDSHQSPVISQQQTSGATPRRRKRYDPASAQDASGQTPRRRKTQGNADQERERVPRQTQGNAHQDTNNKQQTTIHFEIEDTGMGIASEERDRLFEAFTQTQSGEDIQEGTGLGLLISRRFIRLMGGDITVRSTLGRGSTFSFDIQVDLAPTASVSQKTSKHRVIALADRQREYRILVVDDRSSNRILLIKLLQPLGFKVKEAENGKRALEIWETWEPHLIWMDMRMPVMDGYEATKYIKRTIKGNATVVIALTASALEEEKAIVLSAGCDDFVRKPFREEELFEIMAKHLGVRYVYDDIDKNPQRRDRADLLDSETLQVMPAPWREQLYQAAVDLDDEQILALTAAIPEDYSDLAQAIANLVNQFRLDKIIELIEKI
ncbi:MAG: response regulator [Cyanobacteria bacterium P01_E01_bin.42]